jgi:phenylacetate-CoA ligase
MYTRLYQVFWRARSGSLARQLVDLEAELTTHERLPVEELDALQLDRLQTLVMHAYKHVPFYRQRFEAAGIQPADVRSLSDLQHLPVLTKADLRAHADDDEMIAAGQRKETLRRNATGGSTGSPVVFYQDGQQRLFSAANKRRYRGWYGFQLGDKVAFLWGAPRDLADGWRSRLRQTLRRQRWLNAYHISAQDVQRFLLMLERWRPRLIVGYVSVLDLLAGYMKDNGVETARPWAIEAAAEKLWADQRVRIEAAFHAPVYDVYGSREFGTIAAECQAHNGLHVMSDTCLVEVVRDGQPVGPGELGEILVTSFTNRAMPLIRYQIGDLGRLSDETPCPCGRSLPRLDEVVGRSNALVTTARGEYVHGAFFSRLFYGVPGIQQFRVHQRSLLEVDVSYVSETPIAPGVEVGLREQILDNLGQQVKLSIRHVGDIPPLPSGKMGYLVSDVPVDLMGM